MNHLELNPIIIFSVFNKGLGDTNLVRHQSVKTTFLLEGITFKEVVGHYKGYDELSLVIADTPKNRELVLTIAKESTQESILIRDNQGFATLIYLANNKSEFLGQFSQVYESEAKRLESWTYDIENKQYYAIK